MDSGWIGIGWIGDQFLAGLFEFEYCESCGGDAEDHDAVPFLGGWFARCRVSFNGDDLLSAPEVVFA
jgi:hypothetical protein